MELDKIIEILINNSYITALELTKIGYIDEDIRELINEGYLKKDGVGKYVLGNVSVLIEFANKKKMQGNEEFASRILDFCDAISSDNTNTLLKLLDKSITKEDKKEIFKYLDIIYTKDLKDDDEKDINLYLLLLSYLYDVDDKYKDILDDLNLEDILVGENQEDKVRKNLYFRSFYEAKVAFEKRVSMDNKFEIRDRIEKDLIKKTIEKYRKLKDTTLYLMNQKRFTKLRDILYEEEDKNFLNIKFEYLLKLTIDYLEISKNKVVPKIRDNNATNTFEAIKNKDYKKALELMDNYKKEKNINYQDPLYLMLININELVDSINGIKEELSEDTIKIIEEEKKVEKKKEVKVVIKEEKKVKNTKVEEVKEKFDKTKLLEKDKKRIEKQVQEIYNGKLLIIIDKIDSCKCEEAIKYLKAFKEISEFIIGSGDKRKVVVRSRPYSIKYIDIKNLVHEARESFYHDRNYKRAEELYKKLIQIGNPRDITYGEYGLTLLKLHKRREAIPFLVVATELSKERGNNLDYSDLILELDYSIPDSQKKPKFRMREEDFHESKTFNLELDYLNDLVNLVLEDEIDLEEAMNKSNLDEENKNIIRLICARDSYYLKDYNTGDKYYSKVLKSDTKTDKVKKIMNEVLLSKKYYKNRLNDKENQLVFRK